jgi:3-oxoacyl-[acyl-carrier protein] reductase
MLHIDLSKKIAVVTGGGGQLGRVICRTLAGCGADVVVNYRGSQAQAEKVAADVRAAGVRGMAVQADVTKPEEVAALRERVEGELGVPQIVVTNAVIQYKWVSVLEQDPADYESQFRSCTLQNVLMAKAFVPGMVAAGGGRIIAINTECSMQNFPTQSAYVSGKRGMDGLLRVLAKEIGPQQITVNQVAPGWMISDGSPAGDDAGQAAYREKVPLRRRGHDQDVANMVAFLASDLAGFVSGQYISVSGGNVMPAI